MKLRIAAETSTFRRHGGDMSAMAIASLRMVKMVTGEDIDVRRMASEMVIDDIVPPSDLRTELENRSAFYEGVEKDRPEKKHGTVL